MEIKSKHPILYWFNNVKDIHLKSKLISNLDKDRESIKVDSLGIAIDKGFMWYSSNEGYEFWNKISWQEYHKIGKP